jgi:hypothetical protein
MHFQIITILRVPLLQKRIKEVFYYIKVVTSFKKPKNDILTIPDVLLSDYLDIESIISGEREFKVIS